MKAVIVVINVDPELGCVNQLGLDVKGWGPNVIAERSSVRLAYCCQLELNEIRGWLNSWLVCDGNSRNFHGDPRETNSHDLRSWRRWYPNVGEVKPNVVKSTKLSVLNGCPLGMLDLSRLMRIFEGLIHLAITILRATGPWFIENRQEIFSHESYDSTSNWLLFTGAVVSLT